ncbi:MAG: DEAD/DEAH box helicase [Candidatus Heimdallarchaeaceae archaeon]
MSDKEVMFKIGTAFDLIIQTSEEIIEKEILRYVKKNPRKENEYRAAPYLYGNLVLLFEKYNYSISRKILEESELSSQYLRYLKLTLELRSYQRHALDLFKVNQYRGMIVLPTAAGKTIIALQAIIQLKQRSLIIVPTLNLLYQWKDYLSKYLSLPGSLIGQVGDNIKEIKDITVTTYDSARLNLNIWRKQFNFLVLDECHHAAAEETIKILEGSPAIYRMGLTATPKRSDERDELLTKLIGPPIVVTKITELSKKGYVANYRVETIKVPLEDSEQEEYERLINIYQEYLKSHNIRIKSPRDFERYLIFRVNRDPQAKEALDAHRKARNLVFSSNAKLKVIDQLLEKHKEEQIILFSEFNDMVYTISKRYFIPAITHEIKTKEREEILKKFSKGEYTKLVTGRVLDEGWDCGSVSVGIIVSGTGQARQFIQRLGRLLRAKKEEAVLYELVTPKTLESRTVQRRKKAEVI